MMMTQEVDDEIAFHGLQTTNLFEISYSWRELVSCNFMFVVLIVLNYSLCVTVDFVGQYFINKLYDSIATLSPGMNSIVSLVYSHGVQNWRLKCVQILSSRHEYLRNNLRN